MEQCKLIAVTLATVSDNIKQKPHYDVYWSVDTRNELWPLADESFKENILG